MLAFLRLTRPLNLLIIALTMAAMRYGVIAGNLERGLRLFVAEVGGGLTRADLIAPEEFGPQLPLHLFVALVLSTILVAAGGNVINDYFDTRIDRVNKPGEVIVGRTVKRRTAITGHLVLSGLGLLLGAFTAWRAGLPQWALIPAFAIGALWTYSTSFKRRLIIGNGLVAVLAALVPLTVGLYEIPLLKRAFVRPWPVELPDGSLNYLEPAYAQLGAWIIAYTVFAFLSTLVRELQKDMADVKGDAIAGCRTVPIVWGAAWARALVLFHIGVLVLGLLFLRGVFLRDAFSFWYIGGGIIVPLLLSAGFTWQARTRGEHVRAALLMKAAMVMAVGYALLVHRLP